MKRYIILCAFFVTLSFKAFAWIGNGTAENPFEITVPEDLVLLSDNVMRGNEYEGIHFKQTKTLNMSTITDFSPIGAPYSYAFKGIYDGAGHEITHLIVTKGSMGNGYALFGKVKDGVIKNVHIGAGSRIEGKNYVAAIVGSLENGTVDDCRSYATIKVTEYGKYIGGIVGDSHYGTIKDCHNTGLIIAQDDYISEVGGIVGGMRASQVEDCYNKGSIYGNKYTGGICGSLGSGQITECYNIGVVIGKEYTGGILGYSTAGLLSSPSISKCFNAGKVQGENYVGGIAGQAASVTLSANVGNITGTAEDSYVGGIAGSGSVFGSYNNGTIRGENMVGGIVGRLIHVDGCYNTGLVSGTSLVGGIGGCMPGTDNELYSSFNTGPVSASSSRGGLVGWVNVSGFLDAHKIVNCFWNNDIIPFSGVGNLSDPLPLLLNPEPHPNRMYWGLPGSEMTGLFSTTLGGSWVLVEDDYPIIGGVVTVTFNVAAPVYTITPSVGEQGSIFPSTEIQSTEGSSIVYTITPDEGWEVEEVRVGENQINVVNNTFSITVSKSDRIRVSFREAGSQSSIDGVAQEMRPIYTSGNQIFGQGYGDVEIYSITGKLIEQLTANGVFQSKPLASGVYIVRTSQQVVKVVVN